MIKREDVQIFYNINSDWEILEVLVIDSSVGNEEERQVFHDSYELKTGNFYKIWLDPLTPEWVWVRFCNDGFVSEEIKNSAREQFMKIEGFGCFCDYTLS